MLGERSASVEVIGICWHNCVTRAAHRLNANINYHYTDYVIYFIAASKVRTAITVDGQELIPSPDVLAMYNAVIR